MNNPSFSDKELAAAVAETVSATDCIKHLGLVVGGATRKTIKKHIARLDLNTDHWLGFSKPRIPDEILFVEKSEYRSYAGLKKRYLVATGSPYFCSECQISSWNGKEITLQIHHKNGNNRDNRLENLTLLCPNCHSQTSTYAGKKHRLISRQVQKPRCV